MSWNDALIWLMQFEGEIGVPSPLVWVTQWAFLTLAHYCGQPVVFTFPGGRQMLVMPQWRGFGPLGFVEIVIRWWMFEGLPDR